MLGIKDVFRYRVEKLDGVFSVEVEALEHLEEIFENSYGPDYYGQDYKKLEEEIIGSYPDVLYSFGDGNRIFIQLSSAFFDPINYMDVFKLATEKNIPYISSRYSFYGYTWWHYKIPPDSKWVNNGFDAVFEVNDYHLFKKFIDEFVFLDAIALLFIPQTVDEPLKKLEEILLSDFDNLKSLEKETLGLCSYVIFTEGDGWSIHVKSLDKNTEKIVKGKVEAINKSLQVIS